MVTMKYFFRNVSTYRKRSFYRHGDIHRNRGDSFLKKEIESQNNF